MRLPILAASGAPEHEKGPDKLALRSRRAQRVHQSTYVFTTGATTVGTTHMSHYHRALVPGGTYFFTVVTQDRRPLFHDAANIGALRSAFRRVRAARPFSVDAIVVLPDHLHCIWRLPDGDVDYSGRWRAIKKAASRLIDPQTNPGRERSV